jgi:hypothetical protein
VSRVTIEYAAGKHIGPILLNWRVLNDVRYFATRAKGNGGILANGVEKSTLQYKPLKF